MRNNPETKFNFVSIIIPFYNNTEQLNLCLASISNQTYPKEYFEVIAVNNGAKEEKIHRTDINLKNILRSSLFEE